MKKLLLIPALLLLFVSRGTSGDVHGKLITGAAAASSLATYLSLPSTPVKWIQLVAPSGNGSSVFYGTCGEITSTSGGIIVAGAGQFMPPTAQGGYDLAQVCIYIASMDHVYVAWELF